MNGMHRCVLVLLLALASCGSVWRGKALDMCGKYLADNPDIGTERKRLLRNGQMNSGVTTVKDYLLLYHLWYGTSTTTASGTCSFWTAFSRSTGFPSKPNPAGRNSLCGRNPCTCATTRR